MSINQPSSMYIDELCTRAKSAVRIAANLSTGDKNNILMAIARDLRKNRNVIISENRICFRGG